MTKAVPLLIVFVLLMAFTAPSDADNGALSSDPELAEEIYNTVASELMCLCGCNTVVKSCPHTDCGYAIPAKKRIRSLIAEGLGAEEIKRVFVSERGEVALAKPEKKGFNLVGYIFPFVALLVVAVLVWRLANYWTIQGQKGVDVASSTTETSDTSDTTEYDKRLEQELSEFDE